MPELVVETPEGVSLRYEVAGAGSRTAAGLIDLSIFLVSFVVIFLGLAFVLAFDPTGASGFFLGLVAGDLPADHPAPSRLALGVDLGKLEPQ